MSSTPPIEAALNDWKETIGDLEFDDGCDVLSDLHSVGALVQSLQLDVVAHLLAKESDSYLRDYLCLHLGVTRHQSGEMVRVARALQSLPLIALAFREGRIDWARLLLITQLAETAEDDEEFANNGCNYSLAQLKVMVARKKAGDVDKAQNAYKNRKLIFRHNDKEQRTDILVSAPIDWGIALEEKLKKRAESFGIDEITGEWRTPQQAMMDALAEEVFGEKGPTAEMLLDLEPTALQGEGLADLEGHTINRETLDRLACDATIRPSFIAENGLPISLGRKTRLFPPWLSRQIAHRDRGCRFPGCGSNWWIHDHHIKEWDDDVGETNYDNGIQLCGTHHRYVHEGKWKIRGNPNEILTFIRPDGKEFNGLAPVLEPKPGKRIVESAISGVQRALEEREQLELQRQIEKEEREKQWKAEREERERLRAEEERAYEERAASSGWGDEVACG